MFRKCFERLHCTIVMSLSEHQFKTISRLYIVLNQDNYLYCVYFPDEASWRQVLMFSLCVPGSSTRRATQRRNVSSTRPLSTATPSSPSSPSSEPWAASRSTLRMHPERWVSEYKAGFCAALRVLQVVFLCKCIAHCNKGNSYLVICHPSPMGTSLLTPSSAAGHTELLGFSITFITLH